MPKSGSLPPGSTRPRRPLPRGLTYGRAEEPARIAQRGAQDYPMTIADFGRATEARFVFAAMQRGLLAFSPPSSLPSYDVIVDNGLRLFKVQVKGANAITGKAFGPYHSRIYRASIWPPLGANTRRVSTSVPCTSWMKTNGSSSTPPPAPAAAW